MQRQRVAVWGVALVCLLAAVATSYAAEKKAREATINSDTMVYNWKKDTFEFTGNCRAELKGDDQASMSGAKITGKFTKGGSSVSEIIAYGPVRFDITTQPDDEGVSRHITAQCKGNGTFSAATKTIRLTGGAEAIMTTVPMDPNIEPAKFSGAEVIINLATYDLTVQGGVHLQVQLPAESVE